jgi:hypothetical protein
MRFLPDPAKRPFRANVRISMGPTLTVSNQTAGRRLGVCPTIAGTQNGTPSAQADAGCGLCQRPGRHATLPRVWFQIGKDQSSDPFEGIWPSRKRNGPLTCSMRRIVDQRQRLASPPRGSGIKIFPKASRLPFAANRFASAPFGIALLFSTPARTASRRGGVPWLGDA